MNDQWLLLIAMVLIVIIGVSMAASANSKRAELERRLTVTERKLAQLLKKLALNHEMTVRDGIEEVQAHLRQGRKIQAIKAYRQLTGVSLKEAKEAVERMEDPS